MTEILASVFRRYMKSADGFTLAERDLDHLPDFARFVPSEEHVLGWYADPSSLTSPTTIFTASRFIVVAHEDVACVAFCEIEAFEVLGSKEKSEGVRVRTRAGSTVVPISGKSGPDGRYLDALSFNMVLRSLRQMGRLATSL